MTNPRVQQLHQSGATDGQVIAWDDTAGYWAPSTAVSGGGGGGGGGAAGVDDLTTFNGIYGSALGYDQEFNATSSSLPSGWSWVNQGSSVYNEADGKAALIATQSGGSTSGNERHRMIVRSYPSESSWQCIVKVQALAATSAWSRWGLVLRDSASGKYYHFGRAMEDSNERANVNYWSSLNTYGGSQPANTALTDKAPYQRITKYSSTDFDYALSMDGIVWHTVLPTHDPTGNVASFDEIGFLFSCNDSLDMTASIDWFRIR